MVEISIVLTLHQEGLLVGPSINSLKAARLYANEFGITTEVIVVGDRCDELTRSIVLEQEDLKASFQESDFGDPGLARNRGVFFARGKYIAFLDGDDLWSRNWLVKAHMMLKSESFIAHSAFNITFGQIRAIWIHVDSSSDDFKPEYLFISNYWDAMCFAPREVLERFPFRSNNIKNGFGHEDWEWNHRTIIAGLNHRPVPGTCHFKRRRKVSQMSLCDENDVVVFPQKHVLPSFEI